MRSVVTVRVLITAHAALDTMEMEDHALVNIIIIIIIYYILLYIFLLLSVH